MSKITLKNWSTVGGSSNPYLAPELQTLCLRGEVYGHPKHEDGKRIHSSPVVDLDIDNNTARTLNTEYVLDGPDPQWLAWLKEHNYEQYLAKIS